MRFAFQGIREQAVLVLVLFLFVVGFNDALRTPTVLVGRRAGNDVAPACTHHCIIYNHLCPSKNCIQSSAVSLGIVKQGAQICFRFSMSNPWLSRREEIWNVGQESQVRL